MSDQQPDSLTFEYAGQSIHFSHGIGEDYILQQMTQEKTFYEIELLEWIAYQKLPPGAFLDVGAFLGTHTVYFARTLGRVVFSFEPNPIAFRELLENVRLNDIDATVHARRAAVGAGASRARVVPGSAGNAGSTRMELSEDGDIEVVSLDDAIAADTRVALLKIDVEGFETDVLRGARKLLDRERPLVVVECITPQAFQKVSELLEAADYLPCDIFCTTPTLVFAHKEAAAARQETGLAGFRNAWRQRAESRRLQQMMNKVYRLQTQARATELEMQAMLRDARAVLEALHTRISSTDPTLEPLRSIREAQAELRRIQSCVQELTDGPLMGLKGRIQRLWRSRAALPSERLVRKLYHKLPLDDEVRWKAKLVLGTCFGWAVRGTDSYKKFVAERAVRRARARGKVVGPGVALPPPPLPLRGPTRKWRGDASRLPDELGQLRVAVVMDTFSEHSFGPEFDMLQLHPEKCIGQLTGFDPHLLLIESAWLGQGDRWQRKIAYCEKELIETLAWCREHDVPTAFWNKEDPLHFDTFLATARLFDLVFTTDIDSIPRYKECLGHDDVYVLPFACQPATQNPLEIHERKRRFCFAGSYYVRFPDRQRDIDVFARTLDDLAGFDIYDRNYGKNDPNYSFPASFRKYILGGLHFSEIDKAYKGYEFAVNMNSIKLSQSMFARRVFELLACNTLTVSNYSVGMRKLLGDLVISTDDESELRARLQPLINDPSSSRKLRLAGLRRVLSEHTYAHRFAYVASKAFGRNWEVRCPEVLVVAPVRDAAEAASALAQFQRQAVERKTLALVATAPDFKTPNLPSGVCWFDSSSAAVTTLVELASGSAVAGMIPDDYYGADYLTDLLLACKYTDAGVVGKAAYYRLVDEAPRLVGQGSQYRSAECLALRRSLMFPSALPDLTVAKWAADLETATTDGLALDEFHYCEGAALLAADERVASISLIVDQAEQILTGVSLAEFARAAEAIRVRTVEEIGTKITGAQLTEHFPPRRGAVSIGFARNTLTVDSKLETDSHTYVYGASPLALEDLKLPDEFCLHTVVGPGLDVSPVAVFLNAGGEQLTSRVCPANRDTTLETPEDAVSLKLGLRISGPGSASLISLSLGQRSLAEQPFVPSSRTLVLSNHYPEYGELYRNAFLHRRVREYKARGVQVDVFRFNLHKPVGPSEFEGVDIITGHDHELVQVLRSGRYEQVLVHFCDREMWTVLRLHAHELDLFFWFHGSEVQAWHRRSFLYTTEQECQRAKQMSERRAALWREVFDTPTNRIHYVFVSDYLRREVEEDMAVSLPDERTHVIHNFIDSRLFAYTPKDASARTRILSIRPFASSVYANDLTTEAILILRGEPFFRELTFRLVGDGVLFDEVTAPIQGFPNVRIEKKFLNQREIAALHREYGVFLVPSRMDSQGVSRDEAMSSGLVPVTNRIAAVPEFTDEDCAILAAPESAEELAAGIRRLYEDPALFLRLSSAAAARVREQSGVERTIERELELIGRPASPTTTGYRPAAGGSG